MRAADRHEEVWLLETQIRLSHIFSIAGITNKKTKLTNKTNNNNNKQKKTQVRIGKSSSSHASRGGRHAVPPSGSHRPQSRS
jgi:hypothetical protein